MTVENQKINDTAPVVLKNGVIVAGHPRSGTSLACQLVESAKVNFPSDIASDKYNEKGYYELSFAKDLERDLIDKAMTDENIVNMNKVVRQLNAPGSVNGLKIVHIPALFFYLHIAKKMRAVFIFRNPADVKSSMLRRGISSFRLSWFDNCNALIAAHQLIPKSIVISYETLLKGDRRIPDAFKKIGFSVDMGVIKSKYRTQKDIGIVLTDHEKKLYSRLKDLEKKSLK